MCLFQNVKTVPLIVKSSHVNSVQCEVRVFLIILDINQFIHNNDITCRKQSTVPLRHILTVHTHRRRSVEWVGKASLKIYLSSTSFFQIIPFFRFLDPIMSSLTHRGKKHKIGLSLIMSYRKFKLPCHCVLSDCQHSQRLLRSTAESHYHAQQQRDDHHY